ncbi:hypothetical protein GCM10010123_19180 [Pilimelia anulata]|uniref:Uncharacterized protein n=1 Tax=Pilimelia anulata TaxID=53371 RepID=A0A8J3B1W7_9ACTN|nr:hypothetical protein [Pilimelia anulata]GGJ89631.1 hypothetical protein GCM10010123_19180 [Pilimelia anulata]
MGWWRNLAGSLALAGTAAALALGLPALDDRLAAARPLTPGRPYHVGAGVHLVPPAGALLDVARARPARRTGTALFLLGPVRLAVVVTPFGRDLAAAAARLREKITAQRGSQVTGVEQPYRTDAGVPGLAGGYAGADRIGRYLVLVVGGLAVEVTVSGHDAELRASLDRVDAAVRTLTVRPRR